MDANSDDEKFVKEEEVMDWFIEIGNANIDYKNIVYKLIYNPNVLDALENAITILDIDIICMSTVEKLFFKRLI